MSVPPDVHARRAAYRLVRFTQLTLIGCAALLCLAARSVEARSVPRIETAGNAVVVNKRIALKFATANGRSLPSERARAVANRLLSEAVRGLPLELHVVTGTPPGELPSAVRIDSRLPLWRFRDAMAAASIMALPLLPGVAAGVSVLAMAMALGVAVVATRTPWTEAYVADGEDALLVAPGDVPAFRAALLRLHQDAPLRERLAANARRRAVAEHDLEALTRAMFEAVLA